MNVLIIGATSAIGRAVARLYAGRAEVLYLIGRDARRLQEMEMDLMVRGATSVGTCCRDLLHCDQHQEIIDSAAEELGTIDISLICYGVLPDQKQARANFTTARQALEVNGLSVISLLISLADKLKSQCSGKIAVLTSVAGDRGRRSNYTYGAAKSMVSTYLQGLRSDLLSCGVDVIDIRPGPVDSPMTAKLEKGLLWSSPDQVASRVVKAIDRNRHTVYIPGYWRLIMLLVKCMPEIIFKRLNF